MGAGVATGLKGRVREKSPLPFGTMFTLIFLCHIQG